MDSQDWMRGAQSFSLETAVNLNEEWTIAEMRTMETLRAGRMSIKDIAKQLGRSYYSVATKLAKVGAVNQHKQSNKPKVILNTCGTCFTTPSKSGVCLC
jgi:DNA-binding CsgD family transcriptional regulator